MKKIRYGSAAVLTALVIFGLTACGGRDNGNMGTTSNGSQPASQSASYQETERDSNSTNMDESTTGTSGAAGKTNSSGTSSGSDTSVESTGVIDGLLDDVGDEIEDGIHNVEKAMDGTVASSTGSGDR